MPYGFNVHTAYPYGGKTTMTFDIPEVWYTFGGLIHQDFLADHPDVISGFRLILDDFSTNDQLQLLHFLQSILGNDLSAVEQVAVWEVSGSSISVSSDKIEQFL